MKRPERLWFFTSRKLLGVFEDETYILVTETMPEPNNIGFNQLSWWSKAGWLWVCEKRAKRFFGLPRKMKFNILYEFDLINWQVVAEWELYWGYE